LSSGLWANNRFAHGWKLYIPGSAFTDCGQNISSFCDSLEVRDVNVILFIYLFIYLFIFIYIYNAIHLFYISEDARVSLNYLEFVMCRTSGVTTLVVFGACQALYMTFDLFADSLRQ
jgi:hypothetical protein